MTSKAVVALLVALSAWSCAPSGYYSEYCPLPEAGWAYGDTLAFMPDSSVAPAVDIALRHNDAFPYSSLWIEVSDSLRRDTVRIDLCDSYGRWLGTGFGSSHQIRVALPFRLSAGRRLSIRHIMRVDTLTGIEQIGLLPAH